MSRFFNRRVIQFSIVAIVVIISAIVFSVYFFVLRPADKDYAAFINNLQAMQTATSNINESIASIQSASDITDSVVSSISDGATSLNSNYKSLNSNIVSANDMTIKAMINSSGASISGYSNSAEALAKSFQKFRSVASSCSDLINKIKSISKLTAYNAAAKPCADATESASSSPSASFNNQFLTDYSAQVKNLLAAYKQMFVQVEAHSSSISLAAITSARQKTIDLEAKPLNLKIDDTATDTLATLLSKANSQKSSFLR